MQVRLLREEQVKALVLEVRQVDAAIEEGLLAGAAAALDADQASTLTRTVAPAGGAPLSRQGDGNEGVLGVRKGWRMARSNLHNRAAQPSCKAFERDSGLLHIFS